MKHLLIGLTLVCASARAAITDLAWMAGNWSYDQKGVVADVHYTVPRAGTVLGVTRVVDHGVVTFYEYERIAEEKGGLVLYPVPNGQIGVSFPLKSLGEKSVIFENPTHDFPRTVGFALDGAGALHVRVEGTQNGQAIADEYVFTRE